MRVERMVKRLARKAVPLVTRAVKDPRKLSRFSDNLTRLRNAVNGEVRRLVARDQPLPEIASFDDGEKLRSSILEDRTPWAGVVLSDIPNPGMITREEEQYYAYIGRFYSGLGEAVELGPWLGRSTCRIMQGLTANPGFESRQLAVFDDFVWRSRWMNHFVREEERLENHGDFRHLFDKYTERFKNGMHVAKRKTTSYDGNEDVPTLEWNGPPIELLFVDCGRLYHTNEAWYRTLSGSLIPSRSLIVMQDWRLHFEVPLYWENQTKDFTDSKASQLQLVHELKGGTLATFLYRGTDDWVPKTRAAQTI